MNTLIVRALEKKYGCPCCGYKTLPEAGSGDICPVCCWVDDPAQSVDPDLEEKANKDSLRRAQLNFILTGASEKAHKKFVRPPRIGEYGEYWHPLYQPPEKIQILEKTLLSDKKAAQRIIKDALYRYYRKKLAYQRKAAKDRWRSARQNERNMKPLRARALRIARGRGVEDWIKKTEWPRALEFILKAKPEFWQWLEIVKRCDHLHLETITVEGIGPWYKCRYCGAILGCACNENNKQNHMPGSLWLHRLADEIPFRLFREIFLHTGICYWCRKDEDLAEPYAHGRTHIEKYFWRELMDAEHEVYGRLYRGNYETITELLDNTIDQQPYAGILNIILAKDDGTLSYLLNRALVIKKRLKKFYTEASVKEMLSYVVGLGDSVYNEPSLYEEGIELSDDEQFAITGKIPHKQIPMPEMSFTGQMLRDLDLLENPEKAAALPLLLQVAVLSKTLVESVSPTKQENRNAAMPLVQSFEFKAENHLRYAVLAAEKKDCILFLKKLYRAWLLDEDAVRSHAGQLQDAILQNGFEWAIKEYDLYCHGNYSGFELEDIERNRKLRRWLQKIFQIPAVDKLLQDGKIITNIVGMRDIDWNKYLKLDEYLRKSTELSVHREKKNPHDAYALCIHLKGFGKLGYIKKSVADFLEPLMDAGGGIHCSLFRRCYIDKNIDATVFVRLKFANN